VTLADFDADFNLRVSKEVAAQRGYGRKVLDKSCHIAWDHGYGYVKESRIVKFIAKYVGKPYKELAKAWNEWIKPIKNTDKTEMFGKKQSAEPAKVTSTSLAEESAKIIDVFEKAVTNVKEVASRAQAEKEVREQEIIELQTEAANLEAVSNKATAMAEKIGGLLS
jgi:hypothetical protein